MNIESDICSIIIAAGGGGRFRDSNPVFPHHKLLAPVIGEKTTVDITLEILDDIGIADTNIIIVTNGHLEPEFEQRYPRNVIIIQPEQRGNANAVLTALDELNRDTSRKYVLVLQGDDSFFIPPEIYLLLLDKIHTDQATMSTVAVPLLSSESPIDMSTFWCGAMDTNNFLVEESVRKGTDNIMSLTEGTNLTPVALVNAWCVPIDLLNAYLPKLGPNALERGAIVLPEMVQRVVDDGKRVAVVPINTYLGFNTWEEYKSVRQVLEPAS